MRLLRLIPCTHSLRPKSWFEDLLLKGYVTCSTKHTADEGGTTTLNHAIKREIKIQSTSGIQPRMILICFSVEAAFLPVGCLRALAVPTGLLGSSLRWASLLLSEVALLCTSVSLHHPLPMQLLLLVCVISPAASIKPRVSHVLGKNFTTKSHPEFNLVLNFCDGILLWRLGCSQTCDFPALASLVLPL